MVLRHIWRVQLGKYLDLLLDILDLVFCAFKVNNLDSDCLLCPLVISLQKGASVIR